MKAALYADESGSHDPTGEKLDSEWLVIAGYVAWVDDWLKFNKEWQRVLDVYVATGFHFNEWADASAVVRGIKKPTAGYSENPYRDWNLERLDGLLFDLAALVGTADIVSVGTCFETRAFHKHSKTDNPYQICMGNFYEDLLKKLKKKWPYLKQPISFFYDRPRDSKWRHSLGDVHEFYRKQDGRIEEIAFVSKESHLQLQAADMLAYRLRQIKSNIHKNKIPKKLQRLDRLLFKRDNPRWLG